MKKTSQLGRLWSYADHLHRDVIIASTFSILNKIFDLAPPLLIGAAVDIVVKKEDSLLAKYGVVEVMDQLYILAFVTFLVWALESIFEYLFQVRWRGIAQEVQHQLRIDGYKHLQDLELQYYEDKSTGNLISVLGDDVNQLERFLDGGANTILQVLTTITIIGAIFFSLSPLVASFSFLPVPLILIGSFYYQKKIEPRYQAVREHAGLLSGLLSNNIIGMATIKSYTAEKREWERLKRTSQNYSDVNAHAISLSSSFSPLIRMVVLMGFLFTLVLGGHLATTGAIEIGSYSVLIFMTQRLLWPLTGLGATFDLYQRAMASTKRIFSLIDTEVKLTEGSYRGDAQAQEISFENVHFSYEANQPILKNVDMKILPGQSIGLVGPTGSGKSSLVKLLLRFYEIDSGDLKIGGTSIKDWGFHSLRSLFSYVGQDVFLFNGTVEENIAFGRDGATREEVMQACKKAWAHDFIEELPQSYDTMIGERGQKLSGGQKQRLSLARAILKNAPFFIFDEATSAVDNETEALIQRSLDELTKSKTAIIIAHRLSTVVNADQIYVMDSGSISEQGKHAELLNEGGLYEKLWQVQTGLKS
jgi:ATP-binding cassette subfamily B protein